MDKNELKKPLTYEQQIARLREHNMKVENDELALSMLNSVSYYRLTGYALRWRQAPECSDYEEGASFEVLSKLYSFDKELRSLLMYYLEIIECHYRTKIAYGFVMSKCTEPPYDQHYYSSNYENEQYFNEILNSLEREKNHNKTSLVVKHHEDAYGGKMPLWVMVELLSFSNLSKLYSNMLPHEKLSIASSVNVGVASLKNHLMCLSYLRNRCAHGARLYGVRFVYRVRLSKTFLRKNSEIVKDSLFAYCLIVKKHLPSNDSQDQFFNKLNSLIEDYSGFVDFEQMGFPSDWESILKNAK